jgi:hypothetical protein
MKTHGVVLAMCLLGCDVPEKVEALGKRVDDLEAKLKAAEEKVEAHEAVATRVGELEKRVASSEAQVGGVAEAQKADAARIEALKLEVEALKLETTMLVESAKKTPEESGLAEVGVPACDEYVQKYSRCVEEKVPEAVRESMRDALRHTVEAWKDAAANPRVRDSLADACKAALDATKKATEAMGCTW